MRRHIALSLGVLAAFSCVIADANEVTMHNDSLTGNSQGSIVPGFAAGEAAATWLTSTCTGNIVALDVLWRSLNGGAPQSVEQAILVYDAGTFPAPGSELLELLGPQMTDGVINEYRYVDDQQTIPISVPVVQNQTYVVAFAFENPPDQTVGPSVVADTGCQEGKNALFGDIGLGLAWYSSCSLGITGDWVIRAVVDCQDVATSADVAIAIGTMPDLYTPGSPLSYTIVLNNAGPGAATNTSILDTFPGWYTNVSWTCTATGGAACTSGTSGTGSIFGSANLPKDGQITFAVTGDIALGTTGTITNTAAAVVGNPTTDPNNTNNIATSNTGPLSDRIFANGFE